jgi:hypothetical protein
MPIGNLQPHPVGPGLIGSGSVPEWPVNSSAPTTSLPNGSRLDGVDLLRGLAIFFCAIEPREHAAAAREDDLHPGDSLTSL